MARSATCLRLALMMGFIVFVGVLRPAPARAQIPAEIYQDVRVVIEDLLTAEIAQSVVPNLACRSGRMNPEAGDLETEIEKRKWSLQLVQYFPRTLQRIFNRQFETLRGVVAEESASTAAYVVYLGLTKGTGVGDTARVDAQVSKLSGEAEKVKVPSQPETLAIDWSPLSESAIDECVKNVKRQLKASEFVDREPMLDRVCRTGATGRDEYACDVAFALRAVLQGKQALAEEHLIKASAFLFADRVHTALGAGPELQPRFDRILLALREFLVDPKTSEVDLVDRIARDLAAFEKGLDADKAAEREARQKKIRELIGFVAGLAENLRVQWRVATHGGTERLDVAAFLDAIAGSGGALSALWRQEARPSKGDFAG